MNIQTQSKRLDASKNKIIFKEYECPSTTCISNKHQKDVDEEMDVQTLVDCSKQAFSTTQNNPFCFCRDIRTNNTRFNSLLLVLLVLQASSAILTGRYTRSSVPEDQLFEINHLIFVIEAVKFSMSMLLEYYSTHGKLWKSLKVHIFQRPSDCLKVLVPAILYVIQNSLTYIGLSNLSAPVFIALQQGKLIATAGFSILILQRSYSIKQWACLVTLAMGVTIIALEEHQHNCNSEDAASSDHGHNSITPADADKQPHQQLESSTTMAGSDTSTDVKQFFLVGFVAVIGGCFTSAFAGVYFEKVLAPEKAKRKNTKEKAQTASEHSWHEEDTTTSPSLWMRNIQLSFFCMIFAFLQGIHEEKASSEILAVVFPEEDEFSVGTGITTTTNYLTANNNESEGMSESYFHGFTGWVWLLIALQSCGGLLVSAVMKYVDNVLKGLAMGISVVIASLFSAVLLGVHLTPQFSLGATIVFTSVYFFSNDAPLRLQSVKDMLR